MQTHTFKKMICLAILLVVNSTIFGQSNPRLIVRSDDMGSFHSANLAAIDGYVNGIQTSIEVMVVTPWFPEAVKMLREHPGLDVGIHLAITSEWDNIKWRPLTHCPSLVDSDGYFFPMMGPNASYPGLAITENKWKLPEIEQEFRAQIELGLKNMPQASHLTGHMLSTGFDPEVVKMVKRLAEEYNLPAVDRQDAMSQYNFSYVGYDGPKKTSAEKEAAFIKMLDKLEGGKTYMFLDHPAYNDSEMQTVGHIGYEDVAIDRQGVTDLLTSPRVKKAITDRSIQLISYNEHLKALPRGDASKKMNRAFENYKQAVQKSGQDLHSIMILQHGKVIAEEWMSEGDPQKTHILNSVSKTFTASAIGFAVTEGKLKVTDKVISFFPDKLPAQVSPYLQELEIRHLLTMSVGHDTDPTGAIRRTEDADWVETFLAYPIEHKPGTLFVYNSLATYMLSAIIQKVTGEKVIDYLYPRLFRPLGIVGATWQESPQGINTGGWGLYVKTEDMAKLGQLFLQKGKWNGKQILPESWIEEATTSKIASLPAGVKREDLKVKPKDSDWLQGYGYQMWRCRHNAYRADGANGQYIIILPEQDAVIVTTAHIGDMQAEINLIWKHLLPALK
ncbi:ChbG/HpnK family deacetylase [Parabacteroides sp. PF5-9]|uniref:ChbG/HpnK family deacetylase n=1 Tax=Parabacteroides sp. PF5-9 TaxID=1742404 RepID=UPI00247508E2|nr:ChbG/HpnK family deacetylase [Parabacteroides sp. PF5-9]MDH6356945.1 CubicO group peptidase (beta-lactamase class C family)/predicted glycoside hydrolase/deacetylase ChbG (UPF0249 family) [Parabacteroides sp. PF5-9]